MQEIKGNLLNVDKDLWIAHCISQDYALGKGLALQLNLTYGIKKILTMDHLDYKTHKFYPACIPIKHPVNIKTNQYDRAGVFNLVTKEHCYDKPTLYTLEDSLKAMHADCFELGVSKIAVPLLGCGLDKLNWKDVHKLLIDIFEDTEYPVEVLVVKQALACTNNF